jgi:hypothetical protein
MGWVRRGGIAGLVAIAGAVGASTTGSVSTAANATTPPPNPLPIRVAVTASERLAAGSVECTYLTIVLMPSSATEITHSVPVVNATVSVVGLPGGDVAAWSPTALMYAFPLPPEVVIKGTRGRGKITHVTIPVTGAGFTQKFCGPGWFPAFRLQIAAPGIPGHQVQQTVTIHRRGGSSGHCAACPMAPPAATL